MEIAETVGYGFLPPCRFAPLPPRGSAQDIIHCVDEFLHGLGGFVAHIRDAEGEAFDFAVAAVDDEAVLGLEGLDEGRLVEAGRCVEAAERDRAVAFGGEVPEVVACGPLVDHRVVFLVACEAFFDAFIFDHAEDVLESEDQRDGRRRWRIVFLGIFCELDEVEIVAAVGNAFRAFDGGLRAGEHREAGWQGEGLLHTGEKNIDAERIHVDRHCGKRRDRVDHQQDAWEGFHHFSDAGEVVEHTGRGFVVDERDEIESAFLKFRAHRIGRDCFAPLDLDFFCGDAHFVGDIEPLIGEGTAAKREGFFRAEVA